MSTFCTKKPTKVSSMRALPYKLYMRRRLWDTEQDSHYAVPFGMGGWHLLLPMKPEPAKHMICTRHQNSLATPLQKPTVNKKTPKTLTLFSLNLLIATIFHFSTSPIVQYSPFPPDIQKKLAPCPILFRYHPTPMSASMLASIL